MYPETSILIALRDGAAFVRDSIKSVLEGGLQSFEIIVVDDGSVDDGPERLSDLPVTVLKHGKSFGIAEARNTGLKSARGEFIIFLDQDDLVAPQGLKVRIDFLRAHPECAAVAGIIAGVIDAQGGSLGDFAEIFSRPHYSRLSQLTLEHLRRGGYFPLAIWLYAFRRKILTQLGEFDPQLKIVADQEFLYRFLTHFPIEVLPLPVAFYRLHSRNVSKSYEENKPRTKPRTSAESFLVRRQYGIEILIS